MRNEAALELVGNIYDAAFEPELWPQILVRVSEAVGGVQECLQAYSSSSGSFATIAPRRDPDYVRDFHDHWLKDGLEQGCAQMIKKLFTAPTGCVLDFRTLIPPEEFTQTAFCHEWWRTQRLDQAALIVKLTTSDRTWRICGIHKRANDDFTNEETALFTMIAPHLARAFSLQSEIERLTARQDIGASFAKPGMGTIFVDRDANIVFADDEAEAIIKTAPELGFEQGRLGMTQPNAHATLSQLIASCADSTLGLDGPGGSLTMRRESARAPLRIEVLPVGTKAQWHNISFFELLRPVAAVRICDLEQEASERMTELQEKFGMTPAEAAFTLEILKGDGRAAAAARSGISLSTARTHLGRIFDKVGVRRQAELVRLLSDGTNSETGR